jgi:hypothetical protein
VSGKIQPDRQCPHPNTITTFKQARMNDQEKYWFPAKKVGWGWSFPKRWQGWLVLAGYAAAMLLLGALFPPRESHTAFVAGASVLTLVLVAICWIKGEPPKWRPGSKD